MKKTFQLLTVCCLALFMLVSATGGVSAAAADSVWVNGIQLNNNAYLSGNSVTGASGVSATEPASYVAWFHNGTLTLNNAEFSKGTSVQINEKTGPCCLYAEGDLDVVLKGENRIGNEYEPPLPLWGACVKDGSLEFTATGRGALWIDATYAGIFASGHDVTFSGDVTFGTEIKGTESDPVSGIFVTNGIVMIKDHATVSCNVDRNAAAENAAALRLMCSDVSVIGHGTLRAVCNKFPDDGASYGILATQDNDGKGGGVAISDRGYLNISRGCVGISAEGAVSIGKYTEAIIDVKDCGIDTNLLFISQGYLDVFTFGPDGTPLKDTVNLSIDDCYLAAARLNADTYLYDPEELEAIEYDLNRNIFVYDGSRVGGFVFYPAYKGDYFIDCMDWDWATPYNYFVIENEIMGSVYSGSNYFDSNGSVTRGMMVTVLYRLAGSPALSDADYAAYNGKFNDVAKGQWYYKAVVWANKNNVTTGMTETSFAPNGKVTREQLVTFFFRFGYLYHDDPDTGATLSKYKDRDQIASFALPAFRWAYELGIVNGTSSTTLSPKETCTRGQMAKIITVFSSVYLGDRDWIRIAGQ